MPMISPPGSTSSMWIQVPMPSPVQSRPRPQAGMAGQAGAQGQQQPPMGPPPKPWTPPPVVLLPHDPAGDGADDPYGPRQPGVSAYVRDGYAARYMLEHHGSPWTGPHLPQHPQLTEAQQAANDFYGSPTAANADQYARVGLKARQHLPDEHQADGSHEARFAHLMAETMKHYGVGYYPPDLVGLLRRIHEDQNDHAPRGVLADWIEEHGDPLASKVAEYLRVHSELTHRINAGGRLPPKLVALYQQTRAMPGSPAHGHLSMSPEEIFQARKRFGVGMLRDTVEAANLRRGGRGRPRYRLESPRTDAPPDPQALAEHQYRMEELLRQQAARPPRAPWRPPGPNDWRGDQLQRIAQAVRFKRQGRVRRYMLSDIPLLQKAIADNPHDDSSWGALADLLDENGTPETAAAVRTLMGGEDYTTPHGDQNVLFKRADPVGYHRLSGVVSEAPLAGKVHGIRLLIHPVSAPRPRGGGMHDVYIMHVLHPAFAQGVGQPVAGITTLGRRQAVGVMREMEPLTPEDAGRLPSWIGHLSNFDPKADAVSGGFSWHFPNRYRAAAQVAAMGQGNANMPGPRRYSRADIDGLHRYLSNPKPDGSGHGMNDRGVWGMLADAIDEEAKPGAATLARRIAAAPQHYYDETLGPVAGRDVLERSAMPPGHANRPMDLRIAGVPLRAYRLATTGGEHYYVGFGRHADTDHPGSGIGAAVATPDEMGALLREADSRPRPAMYARPGGGYNNPAGPGNRPRLSRGWRYDETEANPTGPTSQAAGMAVRRTRGAAVPFARHDPWSHDQQVKAVLAAYADQYGPALGIAPYRDTPRRPVDEALARRTADAFDTLPHNPHDPRVKAAYDQLKRETLAQYEHIARHGVKMEPWLQPGQPYRDSSAMFADVRDNKHLWFYPTINPNEVGSFGKPGSDLDPENNPLVEKSGHVVSGHPLTYNDLFRAVHDYAAHASVGNTFGPLGEYNAWAEHAKLFSPLATLALTTETHGQNSWVNFGPHIRRPDGSIPAPNDPDYVPQTRRPFADQKSILLPPEAIPPHPYPEMDRRAEHFAQGYRSPAGGMAVRGLWEPGGRFLAAEATGQRPPTGKVRRLLARLRARRRARAAAPIP